MEVGRVLKSPLSLVIEISKMIRVGREKCVLAGDSQDKRQSFCVPASVSGGPVTAAGAP